MNFYLVCLALILSNVISAQDIEYIGGDYNQLNGQDDGQWVDDGTGQWVDDGTGQWVDDGTGQWVDDGTGGDPDVDKDQETGGNAPPSNVAEEIKILCPSDGESLYFAHPFDPTKFIRCVNNEPLAFDCPQTTIWDDQLKTCVVQSKK